MSFQYDYDPKVSFSASASYTWPEKPIKRILVTLRGLSMGGQYSVKALVNASTDLELLNAGVSKCLDKIESQMTVFNAMSVLMQFNHYPANEWFQLPQEMAENIKIALEIGALSHGALDITLSPLVELWGFGANGAISKQPSDKDLSAITTILGHQNLQYDPTNQRLRKLVNCTISLNSIAKGYGADQVGVYLKQQQIDNFMVEVAGEIVTAGHNGKGDKWRLAIEKPLLGISDAQQIINISDMAVATSGDYRKYAELGGKRYSHVIDPITKRPIDHALASVSVITCDAAKADALATAMLVMGEAKAVKFAEENQFAAYFIIKSDTGFKVQVSSEMQQYIGD